MQDDLLRDVRDIRLEKEKSHLTKLRIWYIVIVIIFAALVGAGLWYYIARGDIGWLSAKVSQITGNQKEDQDQTATTLAQWKTYTDTDLGYAFKYPASWDIDVSVTSAIGDCSADTMDCYVRRTYDQISLVRVNPDVITNKEEGTQGVEFWVTIYNKKYSAYIVARNKDKNFTSQKSEAATLTSQEGKKYTFISAEFGNRKQTDLVFVLDSKTVVLSYLSGSEENENITNILKSFRFN